MLKALKAETIKLKRKYIFVSVFVMINLELFWLAFAMFFNDSTYVQNGYTTFLYQLPMLNALFFPVAIGVVASRICDMEHKGSTMKLLFTMQKKSNLLVVKFLIVTVYIILLVLYQILFIAVLGQFTGFKDAFLAFEFVLYFISQSVTSVFILLAFLVLALKLQNQFVPFIVGIVTGFLGFLSSFFPPVIMRLVPSSYFMFLGTVGMDWDVETRIVSYYYRGFQWQYLIMLLVLTGFMFIVSTNYFERKEV